MKKLPVVLLFILGLSTASAQAWIGVKAGFNNSSFYSTVDASGVMYSSKDDFNAGLILSLPLTSGFVMQSEAVYSGEGSKVNIGTVYGTYNFQLLNIPVLMKYVSPYHLFAETGPQAGFLLGAQLKESGFPSSNIKADTKSTEFSWVFGLGYQLPINLGLDVRYNLGLTQMANSDSNSYNSGTVKNNVFQIGLYYLITFPTAKD
jgi:opacity protein-like surface antigen